MTDLSGEYPEARISRTARYRKVTKPLLERRRRARINRCLEELKDLMVGALEVERENINKLEKADILELTVRHLSKLRGPKDIKAETEKFQAGFGQCAAEAYHFILSSPGVDQTIIQQLVKHLSSQMNEKVPVQPPIISPAPSTSSVSSGHSAPSPTYPQEYRSSPSISPKEEPNRYQTNWREDTVSVPVEKSLTCDVSSYNTHSIVRRPGEPTTGLLMTVNDARKMTNYISESVQRQYSKPIPEIRNEVPENRESQDAERKNIILKKIREHIMERQQREPDSTTTEKREYAMKNRRTSQDIVSSNGMIGKSRTESRRNSPSRVSNLDSNCQLNQCVREEAINLTNNKKVMNNNEMLTEDKFSTHNYQDNPAGTKRQATDYKNIHPKKVFIRTPKLPDSIVQKKDPIDRLRNENPRHCDNNCPEVNRHEDGTSQIDSRVVKEQDNENDNLLKEGFQRYKNHFFNLEKEEYYRDPNLEQDDMWRPW